jgi:hypothetical protein
MKTTRLFTGVLGLCGVLLLGGCAVPAGPGYGYGGGGYYDGYSRPYYSDPSPSIYIQGGGYYDSPGYYGRPGYDRSRYDGRRDDDDRRRGYDRDRPGSRPQVGNNNNNSRPGFGGRPAARTPAAPERRAFPVDTSRPGPVQSPNDPGLGIESQRVLRERAQNN